MKRIISAALLLAMVLTVNLLQLVLMGFFRKEDA